MSEGMKEELSKVRKQMKDLKKSNRVQMENFEMQLNKKAEKESLIEN